MRRFKGLGILFAAVVLGGLVLILVFSGPQHKNTSANDKGVCHYKYINTLGCMGDFESAEQCKFYAEYAGAEFVSYNQNEIAYDLDCYGKKGSHMWADFTNAKLAIDDIYYPIRITVNHKQYDTLLSNSNLLLTLVPTAYFFIIPFSILFFLKKKSDAISYPFIFLVSMVFSCVAFIIHGFTSSAQYYVLLFGYSYLISNVVFLFVITYILLYMILTPIYHMTKFHRGELTPIMLSFIVLTDKLKTKFNL